MPAALLTRVARSSHQGGIAEPPHVSHDRRASESSADRWSSMRTEGANSKGTAPRQCESHRLVRGYMVRSLPMPPRFTPGPQHHTDRDECDDCGVEPLH